PILFTERLILRPPVPEDFEAFAAMNAEEDTMQHLGGTQPRSTAWRTFCGFVGAWSVRGYAMFSVIERDSGAWVGRIGA
ncbi:GNAT family N-acetyltransferase, partial [Enterococcus faecium]|uniref:GNAT family N-acetyltransferase n=1 Tax=Enterococcus faecium TaxID=1352 RepID=UPI003F44041E